MTKTEQQLVAEYLATKGATKVAATPMDPKLSASRVVSDHRTPISKSADIAFGPSNGKKAYHPRKRVKRNWAAQARYDEIHGTDNGFDPKIEMWRREQ